MSHILKWFESIITYLVPTILIDSAQWRSEWDAEQNESFVKACRVTFPIVAFAYIANYVFFDRVVGLEPLQSWLFFRVGMATLCTVIFVFYLSRYAFSKFHRIPALTGVFLVCYSQAWVTVYYGKEAWVFFFLMVLLSALILKLTSLQAFIWSSILIITAAPVLMNGGLETANLMSGSIVVVLASVTLRATTLTDVQLFLSKKNTEVAQQEVVKISEEFSERIKSFIPKVIADRLSTLMEEERLSVVEASIEALRAKKKRISCLFTDIRGYTQGSKDLEGYIGESVLPEVSACSEVIESLFGIPRKVGDLIFAYFDDDSVDRNVARALLAGVEVARINETFNATSVQSEIQRYILISSGVAYVGNFGGLDSSIEITALGSPVNFLSRVDDLTKAPELAERLETGDLILDQETVESALKIGLKFEFDCFDLAEMGLVIKDFPEVGEVYRLRPSDDIYRALVGFVEA